MAYRNDLLTWNNWGNGKLTYKPPAFIEFNRQYFNGKAAYYINENILNECIKFWKENYEVKWYKGV